MLKLKREFHNSKLKLIEKGPEKWISNLEKLRICVDEFDQKSSIFDEDFMIYVLSIFSKEYGETLDGLKNCLIAS